MKKRIFLIMLALCMAAQLLPVSALAEELHAAASTPVRNSEGVYEIFNADQLYWFAALVNESAREAPWTNAKSVRGAGARLMCDITVNENVLDSDGNLNDGTYREWTPITYYWGTFDGNGKTISGLYVHDPEAYDVGLFADVRYRGRITNLTIADSWFSGSDYGRTGSIAGFVTLGATIENCHSSSTVAGNTAGGIVGSYYQFDRYYNAGWKYAVSNCTNSGVIRGTSCGGIAGSIAAQWDNPVPVTGCVNNGTVWGSYAAGGIAGQSNYGKVSYCTNNGSVILLNEETPENPDVYSNRYAGGIVGFMDDASVSNASNLGSVTGSAKSPYFVCYVGGIVGKIDTGSSISVSRNEGPVSSESESCNVGGITGGVEFNTSTYDCYNVGSVYGKKYAGGIVGCIDWQGGVRNCFHYGTVSAGQKAGYIVGDAFDGGVHNCYYLEGELKKQLGQSATREQFASGEITYLLQAERTTQIWGQKIGEDMHPVFSDDVVYRYSHPACVGKETVYAYSNTEMEDQPTPSHNYITTVLQPTCTETGGMLHRCSICGDSFTDDETPALGHSYADGKCTVCRSVDPSWEPCERLAGSNRWDTAIKVADQMKENLGLEKFDTIIIASGDNFADALAGSYLSAVKSAPILLCWNGGGRFEYLNQNILDYIDANLAEDGTVYILGGKGAVPLSFDEALGDRVNRLNGANRFETNLMILKEGGVKAGEEILVCTSTNFADSLSASATGKPILLVYNEGGKLFDNQIAYLESLSGNTFTILGGNGAVSEIMVELLCVYGEVSRIAGASRFETSVLVADKYFENPDSAVLAYAWNYPDGLCGGGLAYSMGAPLILTMTNYETRGARDYIQNEDIRSAVVLGGTGLISDDCVQNIFGLTEA